MCFSAPRQGCNSRFLVQAPRFLMCDPTNDRGVALKFMLSPPIINFVPGSVLHRDIIATSHLNDANILLTSLYLSFPGALVERDAAANGCVHGRLIVQLIDRPDIAALEVPSRNRPDLWLTSPGVSSTGYRTLRIK